MTFPKSRKELCERMESGEAFQFFLFYGHKPPFSGVDKSCFSQWFVREFIVDEIQYETAEHWMMAEKARLFDDQEMLERILDSDSPRDAKALGRKVRGFDPEVWDQHKFEIVVRGNREKFSQNADMLECLLATSHAILQKEGKAASGEQEDYAIVAEQRTSYQTNAKDNKDEANVILVEAAGRDRIWGIGLGEKNPKSLDPFQWRGQNLLGFALTQVREELG